jgi:hypothetical protein
MDDETKRALAKILAEIQAMRLIINEAVAVALSQSENPDTIASFGRQDIEKIISDTEKMAESTLRAREFDKWQFAQIRANVKAQLDAIEIRVSRLKLGRTSH